jgi:nitroimidazol reductase NimA-like FMN-containing flavoprotein (pyridoxamine 5'-phosphate oxidase superfamily)
VTRDPRGRADVLSRAECLRLLRTVPIGRVVFVHRGRPMAYPVTFTGGRDGIHFHTACHGALADLPQGATVGFEVDSYDGWQRLGWSVLVHGQLDRRPPTGHAAAALPGAWAPGERTVPLTIPYDRVSGRRVSHWSEAAR